MSSFITNLFPSSQGDKHDSILPVPPPPLHTRTSQNEAFSESPSTPNQNSFITPVSTPQGSPSKNRNPPGANDLPVCFDNAMKITPATLAAPRRVVVVLLCLQGKATQWQWTTRTLGIRLATSMIVSYTSPQCPLAALYGSRGRRTHRQAQGKARKLSLKTKPPYLDRSFTSPENNLPGSTTLSED